MQTKDSRLADLNATLEASVEVALATATSMDLSLENKLLGTTSDQLLCDSLGLGDALSHLALLHADTVLGHQVFRLVLVQVQKADGGGNGDLKVREKKNVRERR